MIFYIMVDPIDNRLCVMYLILRALPAQCAAKSGQLLHKVLRHRPIFSSQGTVEQACQHSVIRSAQLVLPQEREQKCEQREKSFGLQPFTIQQRLSI